MMKLPQWRPRKPSLQDVICEHFEEQNALLVEQNALLRRIDEHTTCVHNNSERLLGAMKQVTGLMEELTAQVSWQRNLLQQINGRCERLELWIATRDNAYPRTQLQALPAARERVEGSIH